MEVICIMLLKCGCTQWCRNKHLCRSKCALTWHRRADIQRICSLRFVIICFHHPSSKWTLCECHQTWIATVWEPCSYPTVGSCSSPTLSELLAAVCIRPVCSHSDLHLDLMVSVSIFFCHVLTHLQTRLSFFAAVCVLPPFPDPPLIHSLPSASENISRKAAVSCANAGMWIQNRLHYVMKGDSISMRLSVYKCQRSLVPGTITFRFVPDWSQCWSHS